jgi:hypothetical protein
VQDGTIDHGTAPVTKANSLGLPLIRGYVSLTMEQYIDLRCDALKPQGAEQYSRS